MTLTENQKLVCAGHMPLRAPDGQQLAAVPTYVIVPADEAGRNAVALTPTERLVHIGSTESKLSAEERYKAALRGEKPPRSKAVPLYIKDKADGTDDSSELTDGEKRTLNPLISDLLREFSAAMREREALEEQKVVTK